MSHYIDINKYWKSSWMHPISYFTINNISLISSVTDWWNKKKSTLHFMVWVIHRTSVCVCERRTSMQWVRLSVRFAVRSKRPVDRRLIPIVLGDPLRLRHCPFSCTCQWTRQCRCFPGWTGRPGVERSLCRLLAQVSCCLCPLVSALCVSAQTKRPLWRRSGKSLQGPADGSLFKEGLSAVSQQPRALKLQQVLVYVELCSLISKSAMYV